MFKYEMHCHTSPVSTCAVATVGETVTFYKNQGYDGVFITNHLFDESVRATKDESYEQLMNYYFSDYEQAFSIGNQIGIKVFFGAEIAYAGTDFLVYGLDKDWFLHNPQVFDMPMAQRLSFLRDHGAFIAHAHPFRESMFIDHIRLFPRCVDAVEIVNANRTSFENEMARLYADKYGLLALAGSDNHAGSGQTTLAGLQSEHPVHSVAEFIEGLRSGRFQIFHTQLNLT